MHMWSDQSRMETYGTPPSSENFTFSFISPSSGRLFQGKLHSFLTFLSHLSFLSVFTFQHVFPDETP